MKIIVIGRGHKIVDIPESLNAKRGEVTVISPDEAILRELAERRISRIAADSKTVQLAAVRLAPTADDLIVVSDYEEVTLRLTIENLLVQKPAAPILVFTHLSTRLMSQLFPTVFFKSDRTIFRSEMRELLKRAATTQKVNALRDVARAAERVMVLIWGNPDPDAIATAFALGELLGSDARSFQITYQGELARPENVAMVKTLRIPMTKFSRELLTPGTALATVDAQPSFFDDTMPRAFDIVVDHHPLADLGQPKFADVRPTYGSTSTIFTEYFVNTGRSPSRRAATALFYGLKTDTANLTRNVSDPDIAAFRHLRTRADEDVLRTIELSTMPPAMLDYFATAIANKKLAKDTVFSWLGTLPGADPAVYVADFLMKLAGISWVIVGCRAAGKIILIFRSDGLRKHAGKFAEELFLPFGTAGGHRTMARAELEPEKVTAEVPPMDDAALERWLLTKLAASRKPLAKFLAPPGQ